MSSYKYDTILVEVGDWVLVKKSKHSGEGTGYWYLVYHKHHTESLAPMVSRINRGGKPMGYRCMTCHEPVHEGLRFLQKMMYEVNDEGSSRR